MSAKSTKMGHHTHRQTSRKEQNYDTGDTFENLHIILLPQKNVAEHLENLGACAQERGQGLLKKITTQHFCKSLFICSPCHKAKIPSWLCNIHVYFFIIKMSNSLI